MSRSDFFGLEKILPCEKCLLFSRGGGGGDSCVLFLLHTCITIDILSVVIHLFYNIRPHILQCSLSGYHNNTVSIYCLLCCEGDMLDR